MSAEIVAQAEVIAMQTALIASLKREIELQVSMIASLKRETTINAQIVESNDELQAALVALIAGYVEHVEQLPEVAQRLRDSAWLASWAPRN